MLSESYKNRLKTLSGILNEDEEKLKENKIEWEYQIRNIDGPVFYKRKKGDENWIFTTAEVFAQGISEGGKLIKQENINENIGPGPTDTRPVSDIFMDKFNEKFQSKDFISNYKPDENIFLDDEKEEVKNQNNLYDKKFKNISKKYRNFKRNKSWKNK